MCKLVFSLEESLQHHGESRKCFNAAPMLLEDLSLDLRGAVVDFPMARKEKLQRLVSILTAQVQTMEESEPLCACTQKASPHVSSSILAEFIPADSHAAHAAHHLSQEQSVQIAGIVELLRDPHSRTVVQAVIDRLRLEEIPISSRRQTSAICNELHSELLGQLQWRG